MSDPVSGIGPARFGILLRVVTTVAALGLWFWTRSLMVAALCGSVAPRIDRLVFSK
jgi:hypothetical protein